MNNDPEYGVKCTPSLSSSGFGKDGISNKFFGCSTVKVAENINKTSLIPSKYQRGVVRYIGGQRRNNLK